MKVDVSIIIAAYNIEAYIQGAIISALAQEGINVEIIIVDDCSTDKTWDILQLQTDPRVKTFQLSQNSGPSAARNKAIDEASGKWIAILDGDDIMFPNRLKHLIETANNQNADMAIDNLLIWNEDTGHTSDMFDPNTLSKLNPLSLSDYIAHNLFEQSAQHTLGYTKPMIKRDFLNKYAVRYNPDIRIGEDYDHMVKCLALDGICAVTEKAGYRYTVRETSISHRLTPQDMQRVMDIDAQLKSQYWDRFDDAEKAAQTKRDKSVRDVYAFTLLVEGIKTKSIRKILKSFALSPFAFRHLKAAILNRI